MDKLKKYIKSILNRESYLYKYISKIYHILSSAKYRIKNGRQEIEKKRYYTRQLENAIKIINENYINADYIVLYNPTWLGVANSTKGLFDNIVPLEQVLGKKNVKRISETILKANINKIIFSQIVDGWTDVLKYIKDKEKKINVKVIWHANNYEVLSDYTWGLNKNVLELYNNKYIDEFAFVKKSMVEFYNKAGYKAKYLMNNVDTDVIVKEKKIDTDFENLKIGVYNANTRELKNIYTQLSAIKQINNAKADIVPTNPAVLEFLRLINLENTNLPDYISTKELLERIQDNDINIYITFTECSPMFPLESFEMGVPCLVGNNNDYFQDTMLGQFVIVDREDDAEYIKEKIFECLKNKELIMNLYKEWKRDFNKKCKQYLKEFIN